MATYLEQSLAKLREFEGSVPWMYRDTAGNVTVGVGLMLPDVASAGALLFMVSDRPAAYVEIANDFARVAALPSGRSASFYRHPDGLELLAGEIDTLLASTLRSFEAGIRQRMHGYDTLPDAVKLALLDMAYNLGVGGLFHDYPRMLRAVEGGDWSQAATECLRHGIGETRNDWTKAQFLAVATVNKIQAVAEDSIWSRLLYGVIGWSASQLER